MKTVHLVARILSALMRMVALGYIIFLVYPMLVLLLNWLNIPSAATFMRITGEGTRFVIFVPFTENALFLGFYNGWYVAQVFTLIGSYGIFFWLLSNVFHTFKQTPLFTAQGVERLTAFTVANALIPFSVAWGIFRNDGDAAAVIIALHLILGVFSYFMTAIFRQGLSLQREQDLII